MLQADDSPKGTAACPAPRELPTLAEPWAGDLEVTSIVDEKGGAQFRGFRPGKGTSSVPMMLTYSCHFYLSQVS